MTICLKRNSYLQAFKTLNHDNIKFQGPLILKMFGALNEVNLRRENRYILCNFLDKYSDIIAENEDIYSKNNEKTLNQLLILAFNKARENNLLKALYDEYISSIHAISEKKEFQHITLEF
jgi:histidyl-tRNA synthetase